MFSIISLLFIVGAAWGVGMYYKENASKDLVEMAGHKSAAIAQVYINSIWSKHHNTLLRLGRIDPAKWRNYREFRQFRQDTINFFEKVPIDDVHIYLKDGRQILQTSISASGEMERLHLNHPPFHDALSGRNGIELLEDAPLETVDGGELQTGTQIRSYAPIYMLGNTPLIISPKSEIDAVIRLDANISDAWDRIVHFQYVAMFGIIGIFILILALLIFFSRRAESIIAKQHEVNLELTAAAAAAESENRDKSMFLANISHELRTPLNAIIGFSEILSNELGPKMELQHREYIRDINTSGKHLLSLINDILEYSKAEAGKLEVDLSEIDGSKMVKNSIRLMIPRAEEGQVTLVEDLPKKSFIMHTDAKKIKQVLLNLLSNSVKFTPPNGQVKVSAWQDPVRERVMFVVSDTGIGIAPKDISKVMAPFGQVESDLSRRYEGTGLGLPLSKRLVELLGGTFTIESEEGRGTTISIDMPLRLNQEAIKG